MLNLTAIMSIAVLCSPHLLPQGTRKPAEQQILFARDRVWRAWFADDEATLYSLVPPDVIVMSAGEKRWKTQRDVVREAREFHSSGGKLMRLTFSRTAIQRFREAAFVYSDYVLELSMNGKSKVSRGRATEVFVLKSGKWINLGWHTDSQ